MPHGHGRECPEVSGSTAKVMTKSSVLPNQTPVIHWSVCTPKSAREMQGKTHPSTGTLARTGALATGGACGPTAGDMLLSGQQGKKQTRAAGEKAEDQGLGFGWQ